MERALRKKLPGGEFKDVTPVHSRRMGAVRRRGNKTTEMRLRAILVASGISGWKLHPKGLPGSPDFYFPDRQLVVFVDGCFWHGCPLCGHIPSVNRPFWKAKILRNKQRDSENDRQLIQAGLRVVRIWEHELQRQGREFLQRLNLFLSNSNAVQ